METLSLTCKDIYPIEITYGKHVGKWIIYLPLVGYAQIVPLEVIDELRNAIEGREYKHKDKVDIILQHLNDPIKKVYYTSKDERGLLNMMILPNNKCNFHCSYCYSAHGRSGMEISIDKLYSALDYFLDTQRAVNERLTISVLGGVNDKVDIALGNIDERINTVLDEEIPILISNNIDQSLNEVVIPTIDTKLDEVLGGSNLSDLIDNKIDNSLDYSNPASPTITDFKSALDYLLYFDLSITFTCTEKTTLEIGSVVNSVTFNWSYNKNILSQSFNGTGLENDVRTLTYNEPFTTNKDFKITASDERKSFSKVISFGFRYGRYWGVSSKEALDTSEDLLAINKELSTGRGKTFTANASDGEYIYYCYPMSWGVGTFSVGGFTGGFELVNNLIFTNEKGHSSTYYIYRSTNHSLGNTVVTVS